MPRLSKEDKAILKNLLEEVKIDMISEQAALGQRASGFSADSLNVASTSKGPVLQGADYWAFLIDGSGRAPGLFPPVDNILDWVRDKGINFGGTEKQTAFLVGRKIAREGTGIYQGKPGVKIREAITEHLIEASGRIARNKVRDILAPFRKTGTKAL